MLANDTVVLRSECDRSLTPWSCETVEKHGHYIHTLNEPEQLRGLVSPHRKDGTQNEEAGFSEPSVVACVPLSTQGRLCVWDIQDSCLLCRCVADCLADLLAGGRLVGALLIR